MDPWPHLSRAPIVEGLIDIRVERSPVATLDALNSCADGLAGEFPSREELRTFVGQIGVSTEGAWSVAGQSPLSSGFLLRSADGRWVAQFRLDGFTVSRLEPYTSWDDLKARAKELWSAYSTVAQPQRVMRVATRFINRIPLPPGASFEKTFATTFTIAEPLPQAVAGFLLRFVVPFQQEQAVAIITQSLVENSRDCTFDLEVFAVTTDGMSDEAAWLKLEQLRGVKNRLFFDSLTPEALEAFR